MKYTTSTILERAITGETVTHMEAMHLLTEAPLINVMEAAHRLRMQIHPENRVTWIIDRNVNISNVCHAGCLFCNFSCSRNSSKAFITPIQEYREKVQHLFSLGGRQLLLQGGLHPDLGLAFYTGLFQQLKSEFPEIRLHALGPPEVVHLSKLEGISTGETLDQLIASGLDSLPGAGAEILSNRVRKKLSPGKCSVEEWLEVMYQAHQRNIITSATMMFGHIETPTEQIEHLLLLRDLQQQRPANSTGFISFIPWPFQDKETPLATRHQVHNTVTPVSYIRLFATARLVLNNIRNLQPSWLTIGVPTAQICLHAGGNDFGSIMIEEHVVSSAGANNSMDASAIQKAIAQAGFSPRLRNQRFECIDKPTLKG
jgi:cyclic dehypoxanthinyl futalosine synthase